MLVFVFLFFPSCLQWAITLIIMSATQRGPTILNSRCWSDMVDRHCTATHPK